jgi:MFS family permease
VRQSRNAVEQRGRRNLVALSAASFFTDVASEMVTHLLPLVLAGVMGASATVIGAIEGVAGAVTSLVKAATGKLSDRWGRRQPLVLIGYGLSALARPFFALAATPAGLAGVRWSDRLGKGIRTAPRDALLADGSAKASRGRAFGLHRAADTAGAVAGVGIAAWLLARSGGILSADSFRQVVLVATIPGFLAVAVIALWVRELPRPSPPARVAAPAAAGPLGRQFWWFLAACALFDLADPSEAFLVLRASELSVSAPMALGLMALANVVYAGAATPAGAISDRVGRRPVLVCGWLLHTAVCLGLALAPKLWLPGVLAAHGVRMALVAGATRAVVADLVPAGRRGTAFGVLAATLGILDLPAALLLGGVWDQFGAAAAFGLVAAIAAVAALALLLGPVLRLPVPDSEGLR